MQPYDSLNINRVKIDVDKSTTKYITKVPLSFWYKHLKKIKISIASEKSQVWVFYV